MKLKTLLILFLGITLGATAQPKQSVIPSLPAEKWWGGMVGIGSQMPYQSNTRQYDLARENFNNQIVPLFISSQGRYVWSEHPFKYQFRNDTLIIDSEYEEVKVVSAGKNLKEAYLAASKQHFPPSGEIPAEVFFSKPQYNTWIELMYNQNQKDILNYAEQVIANKFPTGIFMIDDNWQKYYGNFEFKPEKFPDPKGMIDYLHSKDFKVMLWVCPFVSADSPEYRELSQKGYLIKNKDGNAPALIHWWNGVSACYDMTNPAAVADLKGKLDLLRSEYGVDGFKFDAGDVAYMRGAYKYHDPNANANTFSEAWAKLGLDYEFNELRTSWKLGGQAIVQRLGDKDYSWTANQLLIPDLATAGLLGHPYTCPDMIGGGQFTAFLNIDSDSFNQELIVRSSQVHALMPMMQFSVAPWRILDEEHLDACRKAALLHEEFSGYILELAKEASKTGEPILRNMEYAYPHQGFVECKDQFMLGERFLVAPMVSSGTTRTVILPKGRWKSDMGKIYRGGKTIEIDVPLERLPYFEKIK